jgi:protein-S-isoprenylcysteine O-methyltransferase Ste14
MVILKKQGITVDVLGKGDKPKKVANIEIILKVATYIGAFIKFISICFPSCIWSLKASLPSQIIGMLLTFCGLTFFIASIIIMQNNWRAGYDKKQDTKLVTNGIYRISRNPAFVGFDLLYIGCAVAFPNVVLIFIAFIAIIAFHFQIINEEKFLTEKFGQDYMDYKRRVRRYL